jgi:endonuclease-3
MAGRKQGNRKADTVTAARKRRFNVEEAIACLREAVEQYPKAALFELAALGHTSLFEVLVGCIISIRTRDETTVPVARGLFAQARTSADVARLSASRSDQLIGRCTFHESKSRTIHDIALRAVQEYGGELPCERELLLSFRGVGPKCANLALGIACNMPLVGVDIHVHRVANRWGYVQTKTPDQTMAALVDKLPRSYWVESNALLVPFGKHVCTGTRPKCSTCPLLAMCRQVGVTSHR